MKKHVTITHLYPSEMNIYGDLGNVIALRQRLEWRGYAVTVEKVDIGIEYDFSKTDVLFGGGGQDSGQILIGQDLLTRAGEIRKMVDGGLPALVVCGTYQLFGRGFTTTEDREIPGIGVFGCSTLGGSTRMIGNIVVESTLGRLVGFENHSGETVLDAGQAPLGRVTKGFGNNPTSRYEGAINENAIGTYMHGPLLPKNPAVADFLILAAVKRRFGIAELEPLSDKLELVAAKTAYSRPQ